MATPPCQPLDFQGKRRETVGVSGGLFPLHNNDPQQFFKGEKEEYFAPHVNGASGEPNKLENYFRLPSPRSPDLEALKQKHGVPFVENCRSPGKDNKTIRVFRFRVSENENEHLPKIKGIPDCISIPEVKSPKTQSITSFKINSPQSLSRSPKGNQENHCQNLNEAENCWEEPENNQKEAKNHQNKGEMRKESRSFLPEILSTGKINIQETLESPLPTMRGLMNEV